MYAQLVETGLKKVQSLDEMSEQEQAFQARIDAGVKIEAKDWMPEAYRKTLVRSRRSATPNGASNVIRLPSHARPPCGAMASPMTVITSDLERGGSAARNAAIQPAGVFSGAICMVTRIRYGST